MEAQEFTSSRQAIARRPGLDGPGRRAALTELSDDWLTELFTRADALVSQPFCLVAVGGCCTWIHIRAEVNNSVRWRFFGCVFRWCFADHYWVQVFNGGCAFNISLRGSRSIAIAWIITGSPNSGFRCLYGQFRFGGFNRFLHSNHRALGFFWSRLSLTVAITLRLALAVG